MRALIQRVKSASVSVNQADAYVLKSEIGPGILLFLGIEKNDDISKLDILVNKVSKLRMFSDEKGKMNLSADQVGAELLLVSQFTLAADLTRGTRPSFDSAAKPDKADKLYNQAINAFGNHFAEVQTGSFGADMQVSLVNDGPVSFIIDV